MEEAVVVRAGALQAVRDVGPAGLRDQIEGFIAAGSVAPGVLTLLCAGAATERQVPSDGDGDGVKGDGDDTPDGNGNGNGFGFDGDLDGLDGDLDGSEGDLDGFDVLDRLDGLVERAAGVQLIYDGLRLTRDLAHTEPWSDADPDDEEERESEREGETERGDESERDGDDSQPGADVGAAGGGGADTEGANVDILAADVLVARGFYLLARTDAAGTAVEVVRSFGRDQTRRRTASDAEGLDRNLERDVLELAAVAGATAVDREPDGLREFAAELAATCDGSFPEPETLFSETVTDRLAGLAADGGRALKRND